MNAPKERILVVESDPDLSDLIARQTLLPSGFRVQVVQSASTAIQEAVRFSPDVIIADLNLPGLSGKDMLVAFSAQGLEVPIIVIAEKGMESDVIQSFRLGAADFLSMPVREAEVISAVERVLKQVRARREREMLSRQLSQTNQELQRRVRELTTIFAMGKAVISITDPRQLMDKIVEGSVYVSEADCGWLLLRDERSKNFLLSAFRNLPKNMAANVNQPWDDGLSSLVALSGEPLAIHGEPLKRFKVSALGQAALVVPVKIKSEVVGLLVVVRKAPQPMGASSQALLEAVADYASIAIVNAHLFRALEERARSSQQSADTAQVGEKIVDEIMQKSGLELSSALSVIRGSVDSLLSNSMGKLNVEQNASLVVVRDRLKNLGDIAAAMTAAAGEETTSARPNAELNEQARASVAHFQSLAQQYGVTIFSELSPQPIHVDVNPRHISKVLDGLLSNAIRFSPPGGQVTIRVERAQDNQAHIFVQDKGPGVEEKLQAEIFKPDYKPGPTGGTRRFAGLAIGLPLIREIVLTNGGKVWVESKIGATFHLSFPISNK